MKYAIRGRSWMGVIAAALLAATSVGSTGCGALAALTNPKAAWAFREEAPMSVVVRRADVASVTAKQVERLFARTPVNSSSDWIKKIALTKEQAKARMERVSSDETYTHEKGVKLKVVSAEAWASTFTATCSGESEYSSLLAMTNQELEKSYNAIAEKQAEIVSYRAEKSDEEAALDAKGISDEDKKTHEKKKDELSDKISKAESELSDKRDAFMTQLKADAAKTDDAQKKQLKVALIALRRAVDDAKLDNSVALIRYPMAVPSLPKEAGDTAKRIVADILQEKMGTRPNFAKLAPEVKIDGTDVKLTLAGLDPTELLGLSPEEVIDETTMRVVAYVKRTLTLPLYVDQTQNELAFESKVLDTWIEGLGGGSEQADSGEDISEVVVETHGGGGGKSEDKSDKMSLGKVEKMVEGKGNKDAKEGQKGGDKSDMADLDPLAKHTPGGLKNEACSLRGKGAKAGALVKNDKPKAGVKVVVRPAASGNTGGGQAPAPQGPTADHPCEMVVQTGNGSVCL